MITLFDALSSSRVKSPQMEVAPKYLRDAIRLPTSASSLRPLRSLERQELFVPRTRTTMAMSRSFSVIGPSLWNRLPPSARASHFTFHIFIESKRKNSRKTKHKKTEQRNNVEHKAIILKDKRHEKSNTFLLSHVSMGGSLYNIDSSLCAEVRDRNMGRQDFVIHKSSCLSSQDIRRISVSF